MAGSFSSSASDGLAGMAFPALSQLGGNPFFQTMVAQGKLTAPVFSFRLATSGSELYLGGTNSAHYSGTITYTPGPFGPLKQALPLATPSDTSSRFIVTQAQYWTVSLGGVSVNGSPVGISSKTAIIDSGTTLACEYILLKSDSENQRLKIHEHHRWKHCRRRRCLGPGPRIW